MKIQKNHVSILVILIALGVVIAVYGITIQTLFPKKMAYKDFMNHKLFNLPILGENCCSLWPISHFLLYAILAYIFPDNLLFLFGIGVVWEGIEMTGDIVISKVSSGKTKEIYNKKIEYGNSWVKGSFKDIIFNTAGLLVGFALRKLYDNRKQRNVRKA